jgi:hypothetical protein
MLITWRYATISTARVDNLDRVRRAEGPDAVGPRPLSDTGSVGTGLDL